MPAKKYYKKKDPKEYKIKSVGAVQWLVRHPEDIPMARENLAKRDRGFDNDSVRDLFSSMCLRAIIDYKKASEGQIIDQHHPELTMEECRKFFAGDIFQWFINCPNVDKIEQMIRESDISRVNEILENY